jgi:hypothetical protein
MAVDRAGDEDRVRRLFAVRVDENGAKVREFLRDRADQTYGHAINLEVVVGFEDLAGALTDHHAGRRSG